MKRLVIIGAGFSGAVTAIEFLKRAPEGAHLTIINRSGKMARGLAYGTNSAHHLLNVPAGNMSALVDQPDSFLAFCQKIDPETHSGSFVSRKLYGTYLSELLSQAETQSRVKCSRITGEVLSIQPEGAGAIIDVSTGERIIADHVVLAFGNFSPARPQGLQQLDTCSAYTEDPWLPSIQGPSNQAPRVLLVGSGLTAVDTLVSLRQSHPEAKITMVSRRGLLPTAHRDRMPPAGFSTTICAELLVAAPKISSYMRLVRQEVARSPEHWREVVAALRPITSELWGRLPLDERKRFLRHVQPHWDVYRHRVAPQTFRIYQEAFSTSNVNLIAGRILSISVEEACVSVHIKTRGTDNIVEGKFDQIINCTGPCTDISKINDTFISYLSKKAIICPDELNIGINVDKHYGVIDHSGKNLNWLSYVGPMLKAQLWEATAVPELRQHARALAIEVAKSFAPVKSDSI
ncbi:MULTISPECIES: FAD/NAD(P)-binding protein [unclassified Pseudomonas]|uniref:FAD/NAD(P)-binding protein n=1 Tax=unclassified Pseudomonas TaxID=196821 RepID=UPI000AE4DADD|nr:MULTISPECIES: FAD/NAD(P)-binding protein [unclassified Pseudomonas]